MNIKIKKKRYLIIGKTIINCCIGKGGLKLSKKEGDKSTPKGKFSLGTLYFRKDRIKNLNTNIKKKIISKSMGWCHDINNKNYNKKVNYKNNKYSEKLYRKDHKYDLFLVINYNIKPTVPGKGSAIFLHLTKNYLSTNGCIAIKKEDFFKVLKKINKKSKIIIS